MPNRLSAESSPYLLQHAGNPVDWYPWGSEALDKASAEDKPIFLSIGYSSCHWCHVMERESFEDEPTAAFLNEHFVSIKVDREERPDLDAVYMAAVQALTGQGGWPLSVWSTPAGEPFFGGTYFPPVARRGMPSFRQVLEAIVQAWSARRADLHSTAETVREHLRREEGAARTSARPPPGHAGASTGDRSSPRPRRNSTRPWIGSMAVGAEPPSSHSRWSSNTCSLCGLSNLDLSSRSIFRSPSMPWPPAG
jgi:uncharacterized protein YyaL (SSP411 family)